MSPYELEAAELVSKRCSPCGGTGAMFNGPCPECRGSGYSLQAEYEQHFENTVLMIALGSAVKVDAFEEWCEKNQRKPYRASLGVCLGVGCEEEVYVAAECIYDGKPALVRLCPKCVNNLNGVDLKGTDGIVHDNS